MQREFLKIGQSYPRPELDGTGSEAAYNSITKHLLNDVQQKDPLGVGEELLTDFLQEKSFTLDKFVSKESPKSALMNKAQSLGARDDQESEIRSEIDALLNQYLQGDNLTHVIGEESSKRHGRRGRRWSHFVFN